MGAQGDTPHTDRPGVDATAWRLGRHKPGKAPAPGPQEVLIGPRDPPVPSHPGPPGRCGRASCGEAGRPACSHPPDAGASLPRANGSDLRKRRVAVLICTVISKWTTLSEATFSVSTCSEPVFSGPRLLLFKFQDFPRNRAISPVTDEAGGPLGLLLAFSFWL